MYESKIAKAVENIAIRLDNMEPEFTVDLFGQTVTVKVDMEDGITEERVGSIAIKADDPNNIKVKVYAIPRERSTTQMQRAFAIAIVAEIFCAVQGASRRVVLADAMLLTYYLLISNRRLPDRTASRYYKKAYGLTAAAGCDGHLDIAINDTVQRRRTNATALMSKAVVTIIESIGDAPSTDLDNQLAATWGALVQCSKEE